MQVAVLDDYQGIALRCADWASLGERAKVTAFRDNVQDPALLAEMLKDFECVVLMRERTPFPAAVFPLLPKLSLLITTGLRNAAIDLEAATAHGVQVCGTAMLNYPAAELTWALILSAMRDIPRADRGLRDGRWQYTLGHGLNGRTLALLGLGKLGQQVATVGKAFGMELIAWSPNLTAARAASAGAEHVDLSSLFERADVLTVHVPLTATSRGLVGAPQIARMKSTALLVNTSRGPIVDEAALVDALVSHRIAGAALDVFDREPLPPDNPLLRLDNVVLTPHLGYVTEENYRLAYSQAVEDIAAFLDGRPIRALNAPDS